MTLTTTQKNELIKESLSGLDLEAEEISAIGLILEGQVDLISLRLKETPSKQTMITLINLIKSNLVNIINVVDSMNAK